jgi:hypothetical protein
MSARSLFTLGIKLQTLKFTLTVLALMFSVSAHAARPKPYTQAEIDALFKHCTCVMGSNMCLLENSKPLESKPAFVAAFGGMVQPVDLNYLTIAGNEMCATGKAEAMRDPTGARATVFASRFRTTYAGPCPYPARIVPTVKPTKQAKQ